MRYVTIPEDATITNGVESITQPFVEWIKLMLNDPKFGKTATALKASIMLERRFEEAKVGDTVRVSDEDWALLKEVLEEPTNPYNPMVAKQVMQLIDAILEAPDREPLKEGETEESKG